jgi:hypothetical protein
MTQDEASSERTNPYPDYPFPENRHPSRCYQKGQLLSSNMGYCGQFAGSAGRWTRRSFKVYPIAAPLSPPEHRRVLTRRGKN